MESKNDRPVPEQPTPPQTSAPRKRFRIEKVEERIVPMRRFRMDKTEERIAPSGTTFYVSISGSHGHSNPHSK